MRSLDIKDTDYKMSGTKAAGEWVRQSSINTRKSLKDGWAVVSNPARKNK